MISADSTDLLSEYHALPFAKPNGLISVGGGYEVLPVSLRRADVRRLFSSTVTKVFRAEIAVLGEGERGISIMHIISRDKYVYLITQHSSRVYKN